MRRHGIHARNTSRKTSKKTHGQTCTAENLMVRLKEIPDMRQARVERLRQAIHAGTYVISPARIAEAMLRDGSV